MDVPGSPRPQPPLPGQPVKKRSGCLIALLVGAIVGCTLFCAVGIGIWRAARSEAGQAVLGAFGDGLRLVARGANAPGAKEVGALGCAQALVLELADVQAVARHFAKDAGAHIKLHGRLVTCSVGLVGVAPTCETVARTYVTALGGDAGVPFSVIVQRQDGSEACRAEFDARGEPLPETEDDHACEARED